MASTAASKDVGAFKTPKSVRVRSFDSNGGTPVTIPASPFMKKLGCGTGVNVYLMDRLVVPINLNNTYCNWPVSSSKYWKVGGVILGEFGEETATTDGYNAVCSLFRSPSPDWAWQWTTVACDRQIQILHPPSSSQIFLKTQAVTLNIKFAFRQAGLSTLDSLTIFYIRYRKYRVGKQKLLWLYCDYTLYLLAVYFTNLKVIS